MLCQRRPSPSLWVAPRPIVRLFLARPATSAMAHEGAVDWAQLVRVESHGGHTVLDTIVEQLQLPATNEGQNAACRCALVAGVRCARRLTRYGRGTQVTSNCIAPNS